MVKYDETFYDHQTALKTQAIMESNMFCKKRSFESRCTSINLNRYHSLGIFSRRQIDNILSYLSQKIGLIVSCKLCPEAICMKCQNLFSGKNKIFIFQFASVDNFTHSAKRYITDFILSSLVISANVNCNTAACPLAYIYLILNA